MTRKLWGRILWFVMLVCLMSPAWAQQKVGAPRAIEVMFALDMSGSMWSLQKEVKQVTKVTTLNAAVNTETQKNEKTEDEVVAESFITRVDETLPNLSDIEKSDILSGSEMGHKLLEKMTPAERMKVLWMLKVALPVRRLIIERRRAANNATPAELEVECALNVKAEPDGAQTKSLAEAGLIIEVVIIREEPPSAGSKKTSKPTIRYNVQARLAWQQIGKLVVLPLVRRVALRMD